MAVIIPIVVHDIASKLLGESIVSESSVVGLRTMGYPPFYWVTVVVVVPVFEELFFRGYLFESIRKYRVGAAGAICITSIIWALSHFESDYVIVMGCIFFGLLFGYMRFKTKSVWTAVYMHSLYNLVMKLGILVFIHTGDDYLSVLYRMISSLLQS